MDEPLELPEIRGNRGGRIRVFVVSARFPPDVIGGAERQMQRLCPLLADRGVDLTVLTGGPRLGRRGDQDRGEGYRVLRLSEGGIRLRGTLRLNSYGLMASLAGRLIALRRHWDLVQVLSAHELAVAAQWSARLLGRRCVVKITGGGDRFDPLVLSEKPLIGRTFARSLARLDRVVVTTEENHDRCVGSGMRPDRLVLIPNGVPVPEPSRPDERGRLRAALAAGNELLMVVISNLYPVKQLDLLVEALAQNRALLPPFRMHILGEGAERSRLVELVQGAGLSGHVHFAGKVDPVDPYLAASDLAVHPSGSEGMSNAILEEMSFGLPVVAADIPGNRALIEDGVSGLLFTRGDPKSLGAGIVRLASDPGLRRSLGAEARRAVLAKHSLAHVADEWMRLYRSLLAGDGEPGEAHDPGIRDRPCDRRETERRAS
jgi:glycosyltransferase involved in cell wall biosynthesis